MLELKNNLHILLAGSNPYLVEERLQDPELAGESEEGSRALSGGSASKDGEAQCPAMC